MKKCTVKIPLTKGKVAIIDREDYKLVSRRGWYAWQSSSGCWYASSNWEPGAGWNYISMHNLIMGRKRIDHRDGDGLNNRKINLRPATHTQNMQNRKIHSNNSSGFKGVSFHKEVGKWQANIRVRKKLLYLGVFENAEDAARIYDAAARKHFGEFARLNFALDKQSEAVNLKITKEAL